MNVYANRDNLNKFQHQHMISVFRISINYSGQTASLRLNLFFFVLLRCKCKAVIKQFKAKETENMTANISDSANNKKLNVRNVSKWDVDMTVEWLASIDFGECSKYFVDHRINGIALLMLDENDLKEVIKHNVGQRKNLYHTIRMMQIKYNRHMNKINSDSFFSSNSEEEDEESDDNEEGSDVADESLIKEISKVKKSKFQLDI
jgi:hypothetical protein